MKGDKYGAREEGLMWSPKASGAILSRREKRIMKWLVHYIKCLDFILKVLALGLVSGLT